MQKAYQYETKVLESAYAEPEPNALTLEQLAEGHLVVTNIEVEVEETVGLCRYGRTRCEAKSCCGYIEETIRSRMSLRAVPSDGNFRILGGEA